MTATIIDGKAIAARMRAAVAGEAAALAAEGWAPRLVSISVGDVAAAELYVRNQRRQAEARRRRLRGAQLSRDHQP